MYMNNGMRKHILTGNYLQVYPGGLLNAKKLQINAETVKVDVLDCNLIEVVTKAGLTVT
jgi:hypothetical protein